MSDPARSWPKRPWQTRRPPPTDANSPANRVALLPPGSKREPIPGRPGAGPGGNASHVVSLRLVHQLLVDCGPRRPPTTGSRPSPAFAKCIYPAPKLVVHGNVYNRLHRRQAPQGRNRHGWEEKDEWIWSVPFEACYAAGMEAFTPWLTPALLVALVAWLRSELISRTDKLEKRFDGIEKRFDGVATRFDEVNKRFDGVTRELADLRERMAKLEGALEGFLAGRRDRDAA